MCGELRPGGFWPFPAPLAVILIDEQLLDYVVQQRNLLSRHLDSMPTTMGFHRILKAEMDKIGKDAEKPSVCESKKSIIGLIWFAGDLDPSVQNEQRL